MARTANEALAWIATISKGAPRVHLEAVLGLAQVPTLEDFSGQSEDSIQRCHELIAHMRETLDALEAIVEQREKSARAAAKHEEINTIPGIPWAPPEPEKRKPREK